MQPLTSTYLTTNDLPKDPRFRVKGKDIYLETQKPNVFRRFWRHITGQYNRTKIINAIDSIAKTASKEYSSAPKALSTLLINLEKIELRIPQNEVLHNRIEKIKMSTLNSPQAKAWMDKESVDKLSEILDEKLYDLIDSRPSFLDYPKAIIEIILTGGNLPASNINGFKIVAEQEQLHDLLNALRILTLKDCLALGLGPDEKDFTDYFQQNKARLTQILLDKGFIVRI
jgi:hypothetical protein